jgi:hypothetical protein
LNYHDHGIAATDHGRPHLHVGGRSQQLLTIAPTKDGSMAELIGTFAVGYLIFLSMTGQSPTL